MPNAVIVDAVRSPMGRGRATGTLAEVHPVELLAQTLTALIERNRIDPGTVDDVLIGCVGQNGEQSATPGRQALLAAGFPVHVPSTTIERKCGSGQQAIEFAHQGIVAGAYDLVIAGGVDEVVLGQPERVEAEGVSGNGQLKQVSVYVSVAGRRLRRPLRGHHPEADFHRRFLRSLRIGAAPGAPVRRILTCARGGRWLSIKRVTTRAAGSAG